MCLIVRVIGRGTNKKTALSLQKDRTENSAVPPFFTEHSVHSAGCYHTPVFNADIRSGYSACRAFALPSAAHYAVPLSTWFSATHALCVRAYDFTSASSVWLMKLCLHYSPIHLNVKTVSEKNSIVLSQNTQGCTMIMQPCND